MFRLSPASRRRLLLSSTALIGAVVWLLWPAPATTPPQAAARPSDTAIPAPPLPGALPPRTVPALPSEQTGTDSGTSRPALDWRDPATHARLVEAVAPHCPWPPHPASWHVLAEPCEAALNRFYLTDDWRRVLDDAPGTRRTVAAALEDPDCRPYDADPQKTAWSEWPRWRGKPRPELREACAADAMVRLAKLQHTCVQRLRVDRVGLDRVDQYDDTTRDIDDRAAEQAWDQEAYYRTVAAHHFSLAYSYWENHMCRSVPATAFDWLDGLPEPPGDQMRSFALLSPNTQVLHLYDAARRLGAEVPAWTLPRD